MQGATTIEVPLIASPDDPERTIIGFVPFDTATVELPFEIEIDTDRIGGPSAGLAFTLTLIDELSEGNLLGGLDVAVTGTIDIEGNVGAIGGLPQKVSAVKQVGRRPLPRAGVAEPREPRAGPCRRRRRRRDHPGRHARRGPRRARAPRWRSAALIAAFRDRPPRFTLDRVAISFSRPDPSSPAAVSEATFNTGRRGFDQQEVRDFLRMVAAELARLQERERFLERELRDLQQRLPSGGEAIIDDETATRLIGEEATRILQTAREGANAIRAKGEEGAARLLREATDEAQRQREEADLEASRRRSDAAADAEAELAMAKQQGREMVEEARSYRERVLGELSRRRELARQQIEQLVHGRDRLLQAFERARLVAVDVVAEMTPVGEPDEYVDLSPTTGPVPIMVPATAAQAARMRRRVSDRRLRPAARRGRDGSRRRRGRSRCDARSLAEARRRRRGRRRSSRLVEADDASMPADEIDDDDVTETDVADLFARLRADRPPADELTDETSRRPRQTPARPR